MKAAEPKALPLFMYQNVRFAKMAEKRLTIKNDVITDIIIPATQDMRAVIPTAFAFLGVSSLFITQYIRPKRGMKKARTQSQTLTLSSSFLTNLMLGSTAQPQLVQKIASSTSSLPHLEQYFIIVASLSDGVFQILI